MLDMDIIREMADIALSSLRNENYRFEQDRIEAIQNMCGGDATEAMQIHHTYENYIRHNLWKINRVHDLLKEYYGYIDRG